MNYIVIEDEPLAAEKLVHSVGRLKPEWTHLQTIGTVRQAQKTLADTKADLLFVDIHLSDGVSFQIFEYLTVEIPIIFTTAYDQYALKAFQLNSIDYLLKPVALDDLTRAIRKVELRGSTNMTPDWKQLQQELSPRYKDRFLVSTGQKIKSLPSSEIAFFFASGKNTFITCREGREYLIDQTLTSLCEILDPIKFFQVNRQFIIGIDCITEMVPHSKGRLRIYTTPELPTEAIVSVDKASRFKSWLNGEL